MRHILLAAPFSVRGVMLNCLVGAGMIVIGLAVTRLNRLLKKAQAAQIIHLWREGHGVFGDQREEREPGADPRTYPDEEKRGAVGHRKG